MHRAMIHFSPWLACAVLPAGHPATWAPSDRPPANRMTFLISMQVWYLTLCKQLAGHRCQAKHELMQRSCPGLAAWRCGVHLRADELCRHVHGDADAAKAPYLQARASQSVSVHGKDLKAFMSAQLHRPS